MTDIKHNYHHEGWDAEIYQSKGQTYTEPNTARNGREQILTLQFANCEAYFINCEGIL